MALWVQDTNGDFVNLDATARLTTNFLSPSWHIVADGTRLGVGPFATQADARNAAREIIGGLDGDILL